MREQVLETIRLVSELGLRRGSLYDVLAGIPEAISSGLDFATVALFEFKEPEGALRLLAGRNLPPAVGIASFPAQDTISWDAIRLGEPVVARNEDAARSWIARAGGHRLVVAVPLVAEGTKVGALTLASEEDRELDQALLDGVQSVGNVLAGLIELHRAQEESGRLAQIVEQAAESVIVTNLEGKIVWANAAFLKVTGYERSEVLGRSPSILKSGRQDAAFYKDLWATISSGATWRGRFSNRRKNGSLFEEEATITPLVDVNGATTAYAAIKRDVSEEARLREQVVQTQKIEAIGRLAGGVAHDFNNILSVILGYGELLRVSLPAEDSHLEAISEILKAAERAAGLTRQLLAFSRRQVLKPRTVDLRVVVGELEKMLRRLIGEHVDLVVCGDDDLDRVLADPGQIEQVVMNLVVNARDSMPRGGSIGIGLRNVTVEEGSRAAAPEFVPDGHWVVMSVHDDGTGMTPDVLERLFEPFFTTKEQGKGTGLGLATVYGIVKQTGGYVSVQSEPGKGSEFHVWLPRLSPDARQDSGGHPALRESSGHGETVLVVDDEAALGQMARRVLEGAGFRVLLAGSAREALARIAEHGPPDLLLTDVVMPGMSGLDLASAVCASGSPVRVVYMSGYTDEIILEHGVLPEGRLLLEKPFTNEALIRIVRDALGASGSNAESHPGY